MKKNIRILLRWKDVERRLNSPEMAHEIRKIVAMLNMVPKK